MSEEEKNIPILRIRNLKVNYRTKGGDVRAVNNINLDIIKGDSIGLVGESGCGKSTLGYSIIRLLKENGYIKEGNIFYNYKNNKFLNLRNLDNEEINKIRGNHISMIFQASQDALNPLQTIKSHLIDTLKAHNIDESLFTDKIHNILTDLEIPINRLNNYPFQFSGGMQQRISIALSLILNPQLVICDEPTTALDVLVQAKIINLLKKMKEKNNLSLVFISHDLGVIANITNKVAVMYAGQIVEFGKTRDIFKETLHPYTKGLVKSIPNLLSKKQKMSSIPGSPPDLKNPPTGCKFHPRCEFAKKLCSLEEPPIWSRNNNDHFYKCWLETPEYNKDDEFIELAILKHS